MGVSKLPLLSVVVPIYNEEAALPTFHASLQRALASVPRYSFEIIYCDDGSYDGTSELLQRYGRKDKRVKIVRLTRNFGKEMATTAGLAQAQGQAVVTLDGDCQHPPGLLPLLIEKWEQGNLVVVGLRDMPRSSTTFLKRLGSSAFYLMSKRLAGIHLRPGATDYRLIDKRVQKAFLELREHNRITRGLIDWLGYTQAYVPFQAPARQGGTPGYSMAKLIKLAVHSIVSLSISPLYITAYIGAIVLPLAVLLGVFMMIDVILGDPLALHLTGSAFVMVFVLFLIGVVLMSQGIIGLYLSHIHDETQNRPLYVIDQEASIGL